MLSDKQNAEVSSKWTHETDPISWNSAGEKFWRAALSKFSLGAASPCLGLWGAACTGSRCPGSDRLLEDRVLPGLNVFKPASYLYVRNEHL